LPYFAVENSDPNEQVETVAGRDYRQGISIAMNRQAHIVQTLTRVLVAAALLFIALFCVFGFLASFEPGVGLMWKAVYGAAGCGFLAAAIELLRRPLALTLAAVALLSLGLICVLGLTRVPPRVGYGALAYGCVVGGVAVLRRRKEKAEG
jgi:hypothetical protein